MRREFPLGLRCSCCMSTFIQKYLGLCSTTFRTTNLEKYLGLCSGGERRFLLSMYNPKSSLTDASSFIQRACNGDSERTRKVLFTILLKPFLNECPHSPDRGVGPSLVLDYACSSYSESTYPITHDPVLMNEQYDDKLRRHTLLYSLRPDDQNKNFQDGISLRTRRGRTKAVLVLAGQRNPAPSSIGEPTSTSTTRK